MTYATDSRPEYNFILRPDRLSSRNDNSQKRLNSGRTSEKTFLEKKSGNQEFMWLLKQFGTTVS